jgi:hypothetical protein
VPGEFRRAHRPPRGGVRGTWLGITKTLKAAGALVVLALALPTAALAHTGSATVSCTEADFHFSNFLAGVNTVHYNVTVDDVAVVHGDFALDHSSGAGDLNVPLTVYGTHTVRAYAWWGPSGTVNGQTGGSDTAPMAVGQLACMAAPPAPAPTPAAASPAPAAVPVPAPTGAVQGVEVTSPARTARLGARSVCSTKVVRVTVAGRQMRDIAFSINGRHARTVTVRSGQRLVKASLPMRNRRVSQIITAHVRFRNGAKARNLSARATRCAQVALAPQFTG